MGKSHLKKVKKKKTLDKNYNIILYLPMVIVYLHIGN